MSFDLEKIQESVREILKNPRYDNENNQVCITGTSPYDSPLLGSGSLAYERDKNNNWSLKEDRLSETAFTCFLDEFKSSYLYEIYSRLSKGFDLGRFRIMTLPPKTCYSFHVDKFPRFHIAVFSEPGVSGIINNNRVFEIPCDGFVYELNTSLKHTAFNSSLDVDRTHLVADILKRKG